MIKVYIDPKTNKVVKYEPVQYIEKIVDFDISDAVVVCETTGEICRLQDSSQGKQRLKELSKIKEPTLFEKNELEYLSPKTHMVNVTTEDDNKHYVIHEISEGIDYDVNRGDKQFSSKEKAQEYIDLISKI